MAEDLEEGLRKSMEDLLRLYNIDIEPGAMDPDEKTGEVDYAEVITKTQDKINELNQEAEKIYASTGMTKEELEAYSQNPNNFSKEQWEILENVRAECNEFKQKAYSIIPKADVAEAEKGPKTPVKKKKKKPGSKKGWMQM